jgi:hypothetical protein
MSFLRPDAFLIRRSETYLRTATRTSPWLASTCFVVYLPLSFLAALLTVLTVPWLAIVAKSKSGSLIPSFLLLRIELTSGTTMS